MSAKHLTTIRWPHPCVTCGVLVDQSGWLLDGRLYCEEHNPTPGDNTTGPSGPPIDNGHSQCAFCGASVPDRTLRMIYSAEHECYRICETCGRTIRCHTMAALAGVWDVPRARSPVPSDPRGQ